ncbi:unnamed protein product, partial [Strongylus vulgaris]
MNLQETMKARRCLYMGHFLENRTKSCTHGSMNERIAAYADSSASSKNSVLRRHHRDAAPPPIILPAHNVQMREI